MTTIRVVFRTDEGGWLARASIEAGDTAGVDGPPVQARGRNLRQATEEVRAEAARRLGRDPAELTVVPAYDLPAHVAHHLDEVHDWRDEARQRVAEAQRFQADSVAAASVVADELVHGEGLTLRDAGELLGVSLQRVHQLLQVRRGLDDERVAALRRRLEAPADEGRRTA